METITKRQFREFESKIVAARKLKKLPDLHYHDLEMYCQTLVNGATLAQQIACMQCSDRFDLVENEDHEVESTDILMAKFRVFSRDYLGLDLVTHGDPRGAVFKLIVDSSIGDSFGSHEELIVPKIDAYFCSNGER